MEAANRMSKWRYPLGLGFGRRRPQPEVVTRLGLRMRQSTLSGMWDKGGPWRGGRESNDPRPLVALQLLRPNGAATLAGWAVQGGERLAETRGNLEPRKQLTLVALQLLRPTGRDPIQMGGPRGRAVGRDKRKSRTDETNRRTWVEDGIPAYI
ncbi:hypothetical protein THAOC_26932 [Thalassiosira oceanica]|uniref:Uncharacterized protein n=1 Tax=Thalassiosira oceanica TaxID=159749 RepID=K0RMX0_THAOC|nr:hypothetical protein THAOC_26932 [Thalassiosira oceanica]|eukprot:EJK53599.1 hypothetical protein THAOC_26932 [Thalassiosira oceanica]